MKKDMKIEKKEWIKIIIAMLLCFIPEIYGTIVYHKLPEKIASHYNFNWEPDQYLPKAFVIYGIPAIMAVIELLCCTIIRFKSEVEKQSKAAKEILIWIIPIITVFSMTWIIATEQGLDFPKIKLVMVFLGLLFIITGNYLPKTRRNWILGIRLPWTLVDDENWNYTHRVSGFVWVLGGTIFTIFGMLEKMIICFITLGLMVIIPTIASLLFYCKRK